jgi:hypothetical protein
MAIEGIIQQDSLLKSDFRCLVCGDSLGKTKKLYCASHSTAAGRRETAEANEKIKQENLVKVYVYLQHA